MPKSNIKYVVIIALIVVAALALTFYIIKNQAKTEEAVAATVNGQVITLNELDTLYESVPAQLKLTTSKETLLNQIIEKEVLYQEAKKQGIEVSEEEVDSYITLAKTQSGLSEEEFAKKLAEQKITEEKLKEEYKEQLAIRKLINKTLLSTTTVTDEDIKKFYTENKEKFKVGEQVTARHILIGGKDLTPEQQEEKANSLLKEIKKDNFCDYVAKYSTDTGSTSNCGEYIFTKDDALVQEFKDLAFKQSVGAIGTVKTQFGTHILWTVKKTPAKTLLLKDATEQIKTALINQKAQAEYPKFYEELKQKSNIEIKYIESAVNTKNDTNQQIFK